MYSLKGVYLQNDFNILILEDQPDGWWRELCYFQSRHDLYHKARNTPYFGTWQLRDILGVIVDANATTKNDLANLVADCKKYFWK